MLTRISPMSAALISYRPGLSNSKEADRLGPTDKEGKVACPLQCIVWAILSVLRNITVVLTFTSTVSGKKLLSLINTSNSIQYVLYAPQQALPSIQITVPSISKLAVDNRSSDVRRMILKLFPFAKSERTLHNNNTVPCFPNFLEWRVG